jgi:hypothetical protein
MVLGEVGEGVDKIINLNTISRITVYLEIL